MNHQIIPEEDRYLALYDSATDQPIRGDVSVMHSLSDEAIEGIQRARPDARDSQVSHARTRSESSVSLSLSEVQAARASEIRQSPGRLRQSNQGWLQPIWHYRVGSDYLPQARRLLSHFPKEQVLFASVDQPSAMMGVLDRVQTISDWIRRIFIWSISIATNPLSSIRSFWDGSCSIRVGSACRCAASCPIGWRCAPNDGSLNPLTNSPWRERRAPHWIP